MTGRTGTLRALTREWPASGCSGVAAAGFDDMAPVAEATGPALTTIRQDVAGMGRLMVRSLMERLNGDTGHGPVRWSLPRS